ncbi:hypothetical protein BN2497_4145 [Janthinobacterium sp. CG23_2]|nr:hypothetical protein BN2497_4145 [Janthinobacterium sp. CG23_2]CUU28470.1 hypothetical protein BN3177_4145 [Janthinobacterium sp. CG23_2]
MPKVTKALEGAVKVRVLVACALGLCDDVIEVDADDLPGLVGVVDADPAAVEYAESIKKA